jgi:Cytochrome P460
MRRMLKAGAAVLLFAAFGRALGSNQGANQGASDPQPQYSGDKLVRPDGYREWIYLSSGLGMNYSPSMNMPESFTNVFVVPWAYREFVATGKWPEKSMFVVEDRSAQSKGSINKTGRFQADLEGIAVEVKDSSRFADKWAYFGFGADTKTAGANPKANCWQCHEDNAAVEHTFVQFYPTLKPIAQKFGTYRQQAEAVPADH